MGSFKKFNTMIFEWFIFQGTPARINKLGKPYVDVYDLIEICMPKSPILKGL